MTVGIVIVLKQGVLAIADGRVTNALNEHDPIFQDDAQKVHLTHEHLVAVIGGALPVANRALSELRSCESRDPAELLAAAARGMEIGWAELEAAHPAEFASHGAFRSALLLGGRDELQRPYVALVIRRQGEALRTEGPVFEEFSIASFATDDNVSSEIFALLRGQMPSLPEDDLQAARVLTGVITFGIMQASTRVRTIGGVVRATYIPRDGVHAVIPIEQFPEG